MTLRTGTKTKSNAFTLIELMVVMALLVIVIAVTFPSLQGFFRGRTLESEGRRFLTLTRYAQSRAVSEGIPMVLYVDPKRRLYGLEAQTGFLDRDIKAVEYDLDEKLDIEVAQTQFNRAMMTEEQQYRRRAPANRNSNISEIRFSPEGSIEIMSAESICLREAKNRNHALWINQTEDRLGYEVDTQPLLQRR
jgi:type II secretion system protein H